MVIVSTTKVKIKGVQGVDHQVFLGIPYAKPPIGEHRFQEPLEMDVWEDIKDTFKFMCSMCLLWLKKCIQQLKN